MTMTPLIFKPGIDKSNTSYTVEGSYYDCDKIRFQDGFPQVIGGWVRQPDTDFDGVCRAMRAWRSNAGNVYTAFATSRKLYVSFGGAYHDITPLNNSSTGVTNALSMTDTSAVLTVDDTAHDAVVGDMVVFSGFTAGAGLTADQINQEWIVTSVPGPNQFTVTTDTAATSTQASFGGSGGVLEYLVSPGARSSTFGTGWGAGFYSESTYGTERDTEVLAQRLRTWSLDTWGESLVGTWWRGRPFSWSPTDDGLSVRAQLISGAPAADLLMVTSPDRHMVVCSCEDIGDEGTGTYNSLLVRWCDQEDYTEWTPAITNTSGSQLMADGTAITNINRAQRQNLIWTNTALVSMTFTGVPYTFGFQQLGTESFVLSNRAAVEANNRTYWMAQNSFYVYDGVIKSINSPVDTFVFDDINLDQKQKCFAAKNSVFNEIWWFYASGSSEEIDRYALFNYEENTWAHGTFDRTAWLDFGIERSPLGITSEGVLYAHELGTTDDGSAIAAHIESAFMDISEGDFVMYISQLRPDAQLAGSMNLTLKTKLYPNSDPVSLSTMNLTNDTLFTPLRARTRLVAFRWESDTTGSYWRLGKPQLDIKPNGRR